VNDAPGETRSPEPGRDNRRAGPLFWISAAIGWAVILGVGLRGVLAHGIDTRPANLARFVVGGALLHDLLIAPVVVVLGVLVVRAVPGRVRAPVQAALAVSAIVALFSYPLVRAYGLATHNPTSEPHNYALNLAIILAFVWIIAIAVILRRARDARQRQNGLKRSLAGVRPRGQEADDPLGHRIDDLHSGTDVAERGVVTTPPLPRPTLWPR